MEDEGLSLLLDKPFQNGASGVLIETGLLAPEINYNNPTR